LYFAATQSNFSFLQKVRLLVIGVVRQAGCSLSSMQLQTKPGQVIAVGLPFLISAPISNFVSALSILS
jgi:hypothetical protein